jgi:hypothetical protein
LNKFVLKNAKFRIDEKIKFYFWINVGGITTISDSRGNLNEIFRGYQFL